MWSKHHQFFLGNLWLSSEIFGNLWRFSENVRKRLSSLRSTFGGSLETSESVQNSSEKRQHSSSLLCLCNKQNNTWLLVDMEFLFKCSTWYHTSELVRYQVEHSKTNSISMRGCRRFFYVRKPALAPGRVVLSSRSQNIRFLCINCYIDIRKECERWLPTLMNEWLYWTSVENEAY